jgi:hypothetical protein
MGVPREQVREMHKMMGAVVDGIKSHRRHGSLGRQHDEEAEYEQEERRSEEPPSSRAFASEH